MTENRDSKIPRLPSGTGPAFTQLNLSVPTIEIYIEDKGVRTRKIWESLVRKLLPENEYRLSIIGLGDKGQVIEHCTENQNDNNLLLYVVDADLDHLTENHGYLDGLKYLYRLQAYCIENYLLEPPTISKLCKLMYEISENKVGSKVSSRRNSTEITSDYDRIFDFEGWKNQNKDLFEKLYVAFATVQFLHAEIKNVSCPIKKVRNLQNNIDSLSEKRVEKKLEKIQKKLLMEYDKEMIETVSEKVLENIRSINFMSYVDGKNHLLELIRIRLKQKFPNSKNKKNFVFNHLIKNISPDCDQVLCEIIKNFLKNN